MRVYTRADNSCSNKRTTAITGDSSGLRQLTFNYSIVICHPT